MTDTKIFIARAISLPTSLKRSMTNGIRSTWWRALLKQRLWNGYNENNFSSSAVCIKTIRPLEQSYSMTAEEKKNTQYGMIIKNISKLQFGYANCQLFPNLKCIFHFHFPLYPLHYQEKNVFSLPKLEILSIWRARYEAVPGKTTCVKNPSAISVLDKAPWK